MISIVNYGSGNIAAIETALNAAGCEYHIASEPSHLSESTKILLPGVGAFDPTMRRLNTLGMSVAIQDAVGRGAYCFGICVGMHILSDGSEEGDLPGLGLISGEVKRFEHQPDIVTSIPHIGWNSVEDCGRVPVSDSFDSVASKEFYFLHSFYFSPAKYDHVLFTTVNGIEFASAVCRDRVFGFQFHPEKSHVAGIRLFEAIRKI